MKEGEHETPGGGEQGERLEGSLTDGGSVPGPGHDEERRFGAGRGRQAAQPGPIGPQDEGGVADAGDAGPSGEQSGYGNTPPRP